MKTNTIPSQITLQSAVDAAIAGNPIPKQRQQALNRAVTGLNWEAELI